MALTKITGGVIDTTTSITAVGATFSGNVSVAGTITYDDVTNIDSVGLITARSGIVINSGGIVVAGVTTVSAGTTSIPSISPSGDANTGIFFPSADTIAFGEGGAEAARIDSSGRLLVGATTAPTTGNAQYGKLATFGNTAGAGGDARLVIGSGTVASSLGSGESLGQINFTESTGGEYAQIRAFTDGTSGTNDYPGRLVFYTTADGDSTPTERLRIDSSGRVGIGTSSPGYLLDLLGSAPRIRVKDSSTGAAFHHFENNSGNFYLGIDNSTGGSLSAGNYARVIWSQGAYPLAFATNDTQRMVITSAGNVGIGTTSVSSRLHVLNPSGGSSTTEVSTIERDNSGYFIKLYRNAGSGNAGGLIGADSAGTYFTGGHNTNNQLYIDGGNGVMQFYTNSAERARIDSSGRLLVGTASSPSAGGGQYSLLTVQGYVGSPTGAAFFSLQRGETAANITTDEALGLISFNDSAGSQFAEIVGRADGTAGAGDYPGRLVFGTTADGASSPTERMRITRDGYLFFKKTSTGLNTDGVEFQDTGGGARVFITQPGNGVQCLITNNRYGAGTQTAAEWAYNGSGVGTVTVTSSSTAYNTSSDYRLKENITPVVDGIARLQQLKPSRFNFIVDPDKTVDGFIAHEVQSIVPEAVHGEKDALDDEGNPKYQGIDQSKLVPLLTAALQELVAEVESLKAEVAALKAQ